MILKDCVYLKDGKCTHKYIHELNEISGRPLTFPICGGDSNVCGCYEQK